MSLLDSYSSLYTEYLARFGLPSPSHLEKYGGYYTAGAAVALGYYALRSWAAGGRVAKTDLKKKLTGRIVLITGANTGIGYETALQLAKQGAHVYIACRPSKKTDDAVSSIRKKSGNSNIFAEALDLANLKSVRSLAERWAKHGKPIDLLINNAGVMALPQKTFTVDGNEMQIGTNHLGHFLLTELLLEYVRKAASQHGSARIINVSSRAHRFGYVIPKDLNYDQREYGPMEVYGQSKLANILYSIHLAKQLRGSKITVNAVHPGMVRTELGRSIGDLRFVAFLVVLNVVGILKSPWEGAQTTLHVALSDECESKVTGEYFAECKVARITPKDGQILDSRLETDFIQESRKLVGI
ncbi:uncharacterized protein BJ171DRAFT_506236 [Polychytrium aggregatum]|uniref:uncharacterized protein n=1 Tax=Polychytrium aggregatum TaxID=110093 RepID=UPI0022FDEA29|nr:uncharacterized protein BJ171DRAFT_506236 [Polychytrium aggregatum]KAI9204136.1 hypothetical protein BJ171DRAFT_506236 [Polychytrium aggregatum]